MASNPVYNPNEIEPRWQQRWEADGLYHAVIDETKPKHYALVMLPYPSGDLHIGHWYNYVPADARARFMRMRGYNVMFPIGFDAFGLPAENAAIKHNIHPREWTYANIANMRRQLRSMGAMFDWTREAISADPEYYRWTQWFFNQLFRHGLAYRKWSPVDWCPNCNTTLAREQVWGDDRHCERCGTPVIKKNLEQWFFRTTKYADEMLNYDTIDWPERVRALQTNWIGRSEGAAVVFTTDVDDAIEVFTTRPDTLWGATFLVLAPEHPLVAKLTTPDRRTEVETYIQQAVRQTDVQREATDKEKTGIFTGGYATNPVNGERIPVWIADYVLVTYGTGAIMAVPAHDERDYAFALKYGLPIIPVIDRPDGISKSLVFPGSVKEGFEDELRAGGYEYYAAPVGQVGEGLYVTLRREQVDGYINLMRRYLQEGNWNEIVGSRWAFVFSDGVKALDSVKAGQEILARCKEIYPPVSDNRSVMEMINHLPFYRDVLFHSAVGTMIHSGCFTGTPGDRAKAAVTRWLEQQGKGGAPIPIIYCPNCGTVTVPDDQLPLLLPEDVDWKPTGESPLKLNPTWRFTTCPQCGGPAERETDTMDTFMCSSWYHLRYLSPHFADGPFNQKDYDYWMPVDSYVGGIDHANMHLIYTRFFHKALRDMGITEGHEPMTQLRNQGMILGEDEEKMSKSRGNTVPPDELVARFGADVVRAYLMFFTRWEVGAPWSPAGIDGVVRWIRRVWTTILEPAFRDAEKRRTIAKPAIARGDTESSDVERVLRRKVHQALRQVTRDYEQYNFNTIISTLMELMKEMIGAKAHGAANTPAWDEAVEIYIKMLAPVAPHTSEELWARLGKPYSIHTQPWPAVDEQAAKEDEITLVIQVNGKVRDRISVPAEIAEESAKRMAVTSVAVQKFLDGRAPKQVVYVKGRLVNIVA
jgi:leucyl-tRNA synthetase